MSSKRLPGKSLKLIRGKEVLQLVYDQISKSKYISKIIIATSKHISDNKIVTFCKKRNISVFRGSLNNVASRFNKIIKKENCKEFLRINGDSPLSNSSLIDRMCKEFLKGKNEIVTNSFPRSFPKGQSVEIIKSSLIKKNINKFNKYDLEHVSSYFYKNFYKFKIRNIKNKIDQSMYNLSIDTKKDFANIHLIVSNYDIYDFNITKLKGKIKKKLLYDKI
tara:strand:- start:6029 stop:6688 length:660 start_codon:yes stop_codon:yes gene_type:complete